MVDKNSALTICQQLANVAQSVESLHGLALVCNAGTVTIYCQFEDFDWLRQFHEKHPDKLFLPPSHGGQRCKIWDTYYKVFKTWYSPQEAFDAFQKKILEYGKGWDNVVVTWSDPNNQPALHPLSG